MVARSKSEDKRNAILDAAVAVFAQRGVGSTPTSAISKRAGVAEGTLFTYFATKDVLINELYRTLKQELADAILATFPHSGDVRSQFQHIWQHFIGWGVKNSEKLKVMEQLRVSEQLTAESQAFGYAPFAQLERVMADYIKHGAIRDYPVPYITAMFGALAELTMTFVAANTDQDTDYSALGFEVFWRGIAGN